MIIIRGIYIIIIIFIFGGIIFVFKHKHLLVVLLRLEFIVLRVYFFILLYFLNIEYDLYILMVFLVFTVCEGALGLSILVTIIRTHGNDYFKRFNLL